MTRCSFCNRPAEWVLNDSNYCEEHYELYHIRKKRPPDWTDVFYESLVWFIIVCGIIMFFAWKEILK